MSMKKLGLAISLQAFALAGCYVVPTGVDGNYAIYIPSHPGSLPPGSAPAGQPAQPAMPRVLHARLYPDNEVATQTGEATRVSGDERKGIASAYGAK